MIVREAEASESWCPFVRSPWTPDGDGAAAVNRRRDRKPADAAPCLGSRCMAWRWAVIEGVVGEASASETRGFCGLAGEPRA